MEPLLHIFIWSAVLFYPYIKYMGREGGYMMTFPHELSSLVFKMTISYFLYLWFFPKKKKLKYIPIVIVAFIVNTILYEFSDRLFHSNNDHFWKHFVANLLTYISFGIVFFAIYSMKDLYKKQVEIDALSNEKRKAELAGLKSQINPHFLFNTLNTIYANALKKDDKTPDMILRLSDNFRYVLQEGQKEKVTLKQEVGHLRDYISLQEERLSDKVRVEFSAAIDNEEQEIAPLLLISFLENAFKYTGSLRHSDHDIKITISLKNKTFKFRCKNPFNDMVSATMDEVYKKSGIGIDNTKRRLQHLYPNKHDLTIDDSNGVYRVTLQLDL